MPKISAPTVAEHRIRQREALLQAATDLLISGGVDAVTPAAVGAAAGLSRPSIYQYFSSGADILASIIEDSFPRSNESMRAALVEANGPADVIERFVRELLRQAADGAHRPAAALAAAQLPKECLTRLGELHQEQIAPFIQALKALKVAELEITARLLGGALEAAMGAIESGAPLASVTRRTLALVRSVVPDLPLSQTNH